MGIKLHTFISAVDRNDDKQILRWIRKGEQLPDYPVERKQMATTPPRAVDTALYAHHLPTRKALVSHFLMCMMAERQGGSSYPESSGFGRFSNPTLSTTEKWFDLFFGTRALHTQYPHLEAISKQNLFQFFEIALSGQKPKSRMTLSYKGQRSFPNLVAPLLTGRYRFLDPLTVLNNTRNQMTSGDLNQIVSNWCAIMSEASLIISPNDIRDYLASRDLKEFSVDAKQLILTLKSYIAHYAVVDLLSTPLLDCCLAQGFALHEGIDLLTTKKPALL